MRKQLKMAAFAAVLAVGFTANAQITTDSDPGLNKNTGRKAGGTADDEKSIRLIDNKGTIKYLQAKNGLTQITSTNAGNQTVTTWQLGGTLNTDTYIDVDGNAFALDGLAVETGAASTNTNAQLAGTDHGSTTTTGWTFLVRDEVTGETRKLKASDALNVVAFHDVPPTATAANITTLKDNADTGGVELTFRYANVLMASFSKVQVYRNGAKLRADVDYKITNPTAATANSRVYLIDGHTDPNDWSLMQNDVIEIHATK